jgi:hypothetical protein
LDGLKYEEVFFIHFTHLRLMSRQQVFEPLLGLQELVHLSAGHFREILQVVADKGVVQILT